MDKRDRNRTQEVRSDFVVDERAESLRRAMEREKEIDPHNRMNPTDPLFFPPEKVPYGWVYKWIRKSILGMPDLSHERTQYRKGWSPVPASRHPEEARTHLDVSEELSSDVIIRGGLILCEMPKSIHDKYDQERNKEHQDVMRTLSTAVQQLHADPTVPAGVLENRDDFSTNAGRTFGFN